MSTLKTPTTLIVKTIDSGEVIQCGGITPGEAGELAGIYVYLYIQGTLAGTETITLKLYGDANCTALLYTATASALSGISPAPSGYWLGWVLMSFASYPNVSTTDTLYATITPSGYTRNADTFYMAAVYDWPNPVNARPNSLSFYGVAMRPYVYKELDFTQ